MRKENVLQQVEEKKQELAKRLLELKDSWPYNERCMWCIKNGYNTESIRKLYLMGAVNSIPVAESIIAAIELYKKNNPVAA